MTPCELSLTGSELAAWVAAIATFAAVVVALFKEELRSLWHKPRFEIKIELRPPHCHKTQMSRVNMQTGQLLGQADCYYLRIWVENVGRQRAEQVQVFAAQLCKRQADGSFQPNPSFLPMNLCWSHTHHRHSGPEIFAEGISPGMGKHCDFGHVIDPAFAPEMGISIPNLAPDRTILAFDLEMKPNTGSHLLEPGTYRVQLKVAAANAGPSVKHIEITVDGQWFPEEHRMFADGLGFREVGDLT